MTKLAGVGQPEKAPHPGVLEGIVRQLAKAGAFSYGTHVFERKRERSIDLSDALEVLRLGGIDGPIEAGANAGEWKCKMVAKMDNGRRLGVVTIVIKSEHLFLMTVEWEDTK
jgi:hypothetical protein